MEELAVGLPTEGREVLRATITHKFYVGNLYNKIVAPFRWHLIGLIAVALQSPPKRCHHSALRLTHGSAINPVVV